MEWEGQNQEENQATTKAFEQSLTILREMQGRSSMATSYISMLTSAREAQRNDESAQDIHDGPLRQESSAVSTTNNNTQVDNNSQGMNLDDDWQENLRGDLTLPSWNPQDPFMVPWDIMAVDNPMPFFE